ncbi:hypothetical protein PT974_01417 [Cladobotryum mycophilum]|uniref:Ankyrin 2,3/unc44 n=1 Tax=Cladobotryum mycophilum TaxID=491253 RepID=A0ABR0T4R0_9HYPO
MSAILYAREFNAFTDADVDECLVKHRRDRAGPLPDIPEPIDLDQVNARLLKVAAAREASDTWESDKRGSPLSPCRGYDPFRKLASNASSEAPPIADGGRPWYTIELLDSVSKNPDGYGELLAYWRGIPEARKGAWQIFSYQRFRWSKFRTWQKEMREDCKDEFARYQRWTDAELLRNSFKHPVTLREDPKEQDELTTWIEYYVYELSEYEKWSNYKRRQKWFDRKILFAADYKEKGLRDELKRAKRAVQLAKHAYEQEQSSSSRSDAQKTLEIATASLESIAQEKESYTQKCDLISKFMRETNDFRWCKEYGSNHEILLKWILDQIPLIEAERKERGVAGGNLDDGLGDTKATTTGQAAEDESEKNLDLEKQEDEEMDSKSTSSPISSVKQPSKRKPEEDVPAGGKSDEDQADNRPRKRPKTGDKNTKPKVDKSAHSALPTKQKEKRARDQVPLRRSARIAALRAKALSPAARDSQREIREVSESNVGAKPREKRKAEFDDREESSATSKLASKKQRC